MEAACNVKSWAEVLLWFTSNWDALLAGGMLVAAAPVALCSFLCRMLPPPANLNSPVGKLRIFLEWMAQNKGWAENTWQAKAKEAGLTFANAPETKNT